MESVSYNVLMGREPTGIWPWSDQKITPKRPSNNKKIPIEPLALEEEEFKKLGFGLKQQHSFWNTLTRAKGNGTLE